MLTPPSGAERRELLWLGRLEQLLGLADADVILAHPIAKAHLFLFFEVALSPLIFFLWVRFIETAATLFSFHPLQATLQTMAVLGGGACDGPNTDLKLCLSLASLDPAPSRPLTRPPTPAKPVVKSAPPSRPPSPPPMAEAPAIPADGKAKKDGKDGKDGKGKGRPDPAAEAAAAAAAAEAEAAAALALLPPPRPPPRCAGYEASRGDALGPLRDAVDHFVTAMLRFR